MLFPSNGVEATHRRKRKEKITVIKTHENGVIEFKSEYGNIGIITKKDFDSLYSPTAEQSVFEDTVLHNAEIIEIRDNTEKSEGYTKFKNHFGAIVNLRNSTFKARYTSLISLQDGGEA